MRQKLFTSQGKQSSRSFHGIAEVYASIKTSHLTAHCVRFWELEGAPPRFHSFAKGANDTLIVRAGECAVCRMRPGGDSRGQLSPRCTALHIHSSLCPVAGCACGCFPVLFPREEGEHSSLRPPLDAGRSAGGSAAPAGTGTEPPPPPPLLLSKAQPRAPSGVRVGKSVRLQEPIPPKKWVLCLCVRVASGVTAWERGDARCVSWELHASPGLGTCHRVCLLQDSDHSDGHIQPGDHSRPLASTQHGTDMDLWGQTHRRATKMTSRREHLPYEGGLRVEVVQPAEEKELWRTYSCFPVPEEGYKRVKEGLFTRDK